MARFTEMHQVDAEGVFVLGAGLCASRHLSAAADRALAGAVLHQWKTDGHRRGNALTMLTFSLRSLVRSDADVERLSRAKQHFKRALCSAKRGKAESQHFRRRTL